VSGSSDLAAGYKQLLSRELLDQALEVVRSKRPNLVIINLGSPDYAAHSFGPSRARYRAAIEYVDSLVGDHFVVNTGGASMGVCVRDKGRVAEAASLLRREPWCEAIYREDGRAGCDRTLRALQSYFAGRSPDLGRPRRR